MKYAVKIQIETAFNMNAKSLPEFALVALIALIALVALIELIAFVALIALFALVAFLVLIAFIAFIEFIGLEKRDGVFPLEIVGIRCI